MNDEELKLHPTPNGVQNPIMRCFAYEHIRGDLQEISKLFSWVAWEMENLLPNGPEKYTALKKLLEAKDAAVRAALDT